MQLVLENVTHTYQPGSPFQATAIQNVSLTVEQGEFLALIGHTGSGKSTLAQHMNGLLKPTEGRVLLDGQDIHQKGYDKRAVRRAVGLVFQYPEHQLFEESVKKDIAFGPRNLGLPAAEVDIRVREALEKVGLSYDAMADKSPFELSGGQMRRVAIAGVLAMRPEVLVLDEPTAGLDPMGRDELLRMVAQLHKAGATVVMISHNMDDVARYATRIAVMAHGQLAMADAPARVFARAAELTQMGLDVPQACQLAMRLRDAGLPFPECYLMDDVYQALKALLKGGTEHA